MGQKRNFFKLYYFSLKNFHLDLFPKSPSTDLQEWPTFTSWWAKQCSLSEDTVALLGLFRTAYTRFFWANPRQAWLLNMKDTLMSTTGTFPDCSNSCWPLLLVSSEQSHDEREPEEGSDGQQADEREHFFFEKFRNQEKVATVASRNR